MVAVVPTILLVAAIVSSPSPPPPIPSPVVEPAKGEVVRLYLSSKRVLTMLRVGQSPPLPVVFDTGTNGNLVDLKVATMLGLPNTGPSPSIDGSTGKPVPGYDTFVRGARLGGVVIDDARATAMAYDAPDEAGVFGPNSFPDRLVRMECAKARLVILEKSAATVPALPATPYLGEDGDALPSAVLDFGTLRVSAIMDTGNDGPIILPMRYKDELALEAPPVQVGYAVSAAGRQPVYRARFKGAIHIADVTLEHPTLQFMEGGRPNIGLAVLRSLTVVFDPTGRRSWILPSADETAPLAGKPSSPP